MTQRFFIMFSGYRCYWIFLTKSEKSQMCWLRAHHITVFDEMTDTCLVLLSEKSYQTDYSYGTYWYKWKSSRRRRVAARNFRRRQIETINENYKDTVCLKNLLFDIIRILCCRYRTIHIALCKMCTNCTSCNLSVLNICRLICINKNCVL